MELKNIFKMTKTDRYTQDGRDELAKLQETEDVKYKTGDISQKTGLQKQPDGSWAPPKGGSKTAGRNLGTKRVERGPGAIHTPGKGSVGLEQMKEAAEAGLKGEALKEFMLGKKSESKLAAGNKTTIRQGPNTKTLNETPAEHVQKNLDAYKGYQAYDMEELVLKPSGYKRQTSARIPSGGQSVTYTKEGGEDITLFFDKDGELENADVSAGSKPDAAEQRDQIGSEIKESLDAAKYYYQKAQSFSPTDPSYKTYMAKAKQYNDEAKAQADDNGFEFEEMHNSGITNAVNKYAEEQSKPKTYTSKEGRRNFRAALEDNPKDAYDFSKTVEHSIPMSAGDKEQLANIKSFMQDENTDYKDAIKSVATGLVNGNQMRGDWYPEKEQSVLKIAKSVGLEKELMNYIKANHKGYEFGYSEDAAPRELTGDCKIKIRPETQDVKYKTGDISQKTGLQKQPDGSWKPPRNGSKAAAGSEKPANIPSHQGMTAEDYDNKLRAEGWSNSGWESVPGNRAMGIFKKDGKTIRVMQNSDGKLASVEEIKPKAEAKPAVKTPAESKKGQTLNTFRTGNSDYRWDVTIKGGENSLANEFFEQHGARFNYHGKDVNLDDYVKPIDNNSFELKVFNAGNQSQGYYGKLAGKGNNTDIRYIVTKTPNGWNIQEKERRYYGLPERQQEYKLDNNKYIKDTPKDSAPRVLTGDTRIRVKK